MECLQGEVDSHNFPSDTPLLNPLVGFADGHQGGARRQLDAPAQSANGIPPVEDAGQMGAAFLI